ncbi:Hachiman antiphage defense system protein HamA [Nostoc sp. DSM 114160]|jgi:replicative superfamily II helicase
MPFLQDFTANLVLVSYAKSIAKDFERQKVNLKNIETFLRHLQLIIPYFCRHPQGIIEELEKLKEDGLESVLKDLHQMTQGSVQVWNGTIGEAIASSYILGCTDYKIPVFKLRFATNRKMAMHGDDVLGLKFNANGIPQALLVTEVKNYGSNPKEAVKKASEGLLKVQEGLVTLLDFIINVLRGAGRYNEAKLVNRFNDTYTYSYRTEYLAVVVTEQEKWKEQYFDAVVEGITTPLTVNAFLIPNWIAHQKNLVNSQKNQEPSKLSFPSIEIDELKDIVNLLNNSDFKKEHNQLASEALTIDLRNEQRKFISYKYDPIKLEKAANFLALTGYNLLMDGSEEAEKVLKESAVIHERLAILRIEDGQAYIAVENIVTSALLYSIAGYNANAKVLVSKILYRQDIKDVLLSNTPRILLTYLLTGEISQLQDALAQFFFKFAQKELESSDYPLEEEEWMDLVSAKIADIGDWLTAKAFANFTQYLRTGNESHQTEILKLTIAAGKQYATVSDYHSYVLLNSIGKYLQSLINHSTQRLVSPHVPDMNAEWKLYLRFLCTLGKFPMMSMWKSQQKALHEGLLTDKSLVIAMPTSAGKTKTVELAIYRSLKDKPDKVCAYVVPTKALAYEVESSLSTSLSRVNIAVSILYGGYDFSQLEEDILQDNQVFVLTPEKLDLLTRNSEEFKSKLALIIIDEAHDSAAANPRSLRQELIYSRLLTIAEKNHARVIGISAVINNTSDFAQWLSGNENNVVKIDWRPTKQRLGFFEWSQTTRATVCYLPQTGDYPSDNFFVPLPFLKPRSLMKNRNGKSYRSYVEVAARLAIYYTQTGSTLVFTTTKPIVEAIAECLISLLQKQPLAVSPEMQQIADECGELLGSEHLLVKAIALGFCYHHAELPNVVRRRIENAVRDNIIPLIVSTTTLSQGVNLPIKNVIVHSLSMDNMISMAQYANAVGRAGRAGCETEGHIIFCDSKDLERVRQEAPTEVSESFIVSGIKHLAQSRLLSLETTEDFLSLWSLASTSQFRKAGNDYEHWTKKKQTLASKNQTEILSYLDSQLLAWILESCLDEVDEEKVEFIFKKLLCHVQSLDIEDVLLEFKNALKARIILLKNEVTDIQQRKLFNLTGLSVGSNQVITAYAQKLVGEIDNYTAVSDLPITFWQESYDVFKKIPELTEGLKLDSIEPLIGWLQGKDYKELADLYFEGKTETVVKKLEKVTHAFAWGFDSLIRHIGFYFNNQKIPNVFNSLTSFVTHGVSTTSAVYAISLGVYDRQIAITLSNAYQTLYPQTEYPIFKEWLFNLDFGQWVQLLKLSNGSSRKIEECFDNVQQKQQTLQTNQKVFDCTFIDVGKSLKLDDSIKLDELLVVGFDDHLWLVTYDYQKYWQLCGENVDKLKRFNRQMQDLILQKIDVQQATVTISVH